MGATVLESIIRAHKKLFTSYNISDIGSRADEYARPAEGTERASYCIDP
jgi:hypothetical protein